MTLLMIAKTSPAFANTVKSAESFPACNKAVAYMIVEQCLIKYKCVLFHL